MLVYINEEYFLLQSDQNGAKYGSTEGSAAWACSFEKLLDDPMGLHVFAVSFHKLIIKNFTLLMNWSFIIVLFFYWSYYRLHLHRVKKYLYW